MAIGLYLAFVMLMGTAAGIAYFAEGVDYCNEFKFAARADNLLPSSFDDKDWNALSFEERANGSPEYSLWERRNN